MNLCTMSLVNSLFTQVSSSDLIWLAISFLPRYMPCPLWHSSLWALVIKRLGLQQQRIQAYLVLLCFALSCFANVAFFFFFFTILRFVATLLLPSVFPFFFFFFLQIEGLWQPCTEQVLLPFLFFLIEFIDFCFGCNGSLLLCAGFL